MRKQLTLVATGLAALFALTACGGGTSTAPSADATLDPANPTVVKVGASPVPHAKILEFVDANLAQKAGIDLQIQEFDDYQTPNVALSEGSIDANYYQHLPWFEDQVKTKGYKFEHGAGIHVEPYVAYSGKHTSISEVPNGGVVAITNDPSNQLRALRLLEAEGLLKDIQDDTTVLTLTDAQNPKGLKFEENQPEILVTLIDDPKVDVALINGNFTIGAGLDSSSAIAVEKVDPKYANFLVWRAGEETPAIAKLDELLHSDEVRDYITQTWPNGDVTPAF